MAKVRGKNTFPELAVRLTLFKKGYRYRIHSKKLPGIPDIVLPKYRAAIFVHGCFWHGHCCKGGKLPDANKDFWSTKIQENQKRDQTNIEKLNQLGWKVLVIWECSLKGSRKKNIENIINKTINWIEYEQKNNEIYDLS